MAQGEVQDVVDDNSHMPVPDVSVAVYPEGQVVPQAVPYR